MLINLDRTGEDRIPASAKKIWSGSSSPFAFQCYFYYLWIIITINIIKVFITVTMVIITVIMVIIWVIMIMIIISKKTPYMEQCRRQGTTTGRFLSYSLLSASPCKNCTTSSSSSSSSPLCPPFIASSSVLLIFIIMIIPAAEGCCNKTQLAHASIFIALFRLQPGLPQL